MDRFVRIGTFSSHQRDRLAGGYRWLSAQPSWIVRVAVLTFLVVFGLPILLLAFVAFIAAAVVLGGLALLDRGIRRIRGLARGDGRKNVRVIRKRG